MTLRSAHLLLWFVAIVAVTGVLLFLALPKEGTPPDDVPGMARWLASHPADWLTASILSDRALDTDSPRRVVLWRASHELARRLAPRRRNTTAGFVRAGLLHWEQLAAAEQQAVLRALEPLLRDITVFRDIATPLYDLTHDFAMLRRGAPDSLEALALLRDVAINNGLTAEYRELRDALRRKRLAEFEARHASLAPRDLLGQLSFQPRADDHPFITRVLTELQRRPIDANAGVRDLARDVIDYAIDHRLGPLDGLEALALDTKSAPDATRARLALALGDVPRAAQIEMTYDTAGSAEWHEYHIERALFEARRGDFIAAEVHLDRAGSSIEATATRHDVARLQGRSTSLPQTAPEWLSLCSGDICRGTHTTITATAPRTLPLTLAVVQTDQVAPYVEIYVDDLRVAEGEIEMQRTFEVPLREGVQRVEIVVVNAMTRGGAYRRVRVAESRP
ncbi:MAG TPA: hypothetical protein VF618_20415 [Thermoanaerobaculia bacterium]